jgi:hypothetical protein
MAHEPIPPYPKNAPGDFYVENRSCLKCEAPYDMAPDVMAHAEEGVDPHCYFKKQPETPEEVERAVMACYVSCVRAVRYAGKNPKILKRFRELGRIDFCDTLAGGESFEGGKEPDPQDNESPRPLLLPNHGSVHPLWDRDLDG